MAHLLVDFITSLDSYGTADDWPGYWGLEGPEYLGWLAEDGTEEHTVLMGATTYRELSGYAVRLPEDPGLAALTATPKVVFSSTLEPPLEWANTELVGGDVAATVRRLKGEGRSLRTVGSVRLGRTLFEERLVDRLRVVVFPVVTGASGRQRLFEDYPDIRLELVETRTFDGRLQLLEYVPTVLDEPPGPDL